MECMIRDVNLYYEIHGEGTPILMIHGWGPDHRMMKGCMEPVFEKSKGVWKRIYLDLPGMGRTGGKPWITGSDQVLELILGLLDHVIPGQHFLIAGESYGGYLARGILCKRQWAVDGLLLLCPMTMQDSGEEPPVVFEVLEKDPVLLKRLSDEERHYFEMEGVNAVQDERVWERFRKEVLPGFLLTDHTFLKSYLGQNVLFRFPEDALEDPFKKPALLLAGRQDSLVGYRGLWKIFEKYPRATFAVLDKAGHSLQITQDTLFTELVREWLDRVAAEPGR